MGIVVTFNVIGVQHQVNGLKSWWWSCLNAQLTTISHTDCILMLCGKNNNVNGPVLAHGAERWQRLISPTVETSQSAWGLVPSTCVSAGRVTLIMLSTNTSCRSHPLIPHTLTMLTDQHLCLIYCICCTNSRLPHNNIIAALDFVFKV